MKSLTLLAAALVLTLGYSVPASAKGQGAGITYVNHSGGGDRYRSSRHGFSSPRYGYTSRRYSDRYRRNDRRRPQYRDTYWRRGHGHSHYRPYWPHRHPQVARKRLTKKHIRRLARRHYPSILRLEFDNGHYNVWARDHRGQRIRIGYDAFTGAFLGYLYLR